MSVLSIGMEAIERGLVPDRFTRMAIRNLCAHRLRVCENNSATSRTYSTAQSQFQTSLREGPIAPVPEKANEQHYELPPEFFSAVLGPRRKYSCCYWPTGVRSLEAAEDKSLSVTCERARLDDGQNILELGCGWGSLSLWMAEHYPGSRITVVSNSTAQKQFIDRQIALRGLSNLRTVTADMNDFDPARVPGGDIRFDRVVSVEMFEHMRNYDLLLERVASWLYPHGKLFVHMFCHRKHAYAFEANGASNWMGRYFFTGGIMPSVDLLHSFNRHLTVTAEWRWDGTHYQRTAEAWLANLDNRSWELLPMFSRVYGAVHSRRWLHRWRLFFLAVAELFGCNKGEEWFVSHSLLEPNV